nr:monovalent cation/H(+) antiporter subunit G [Bacillus velezensis]
MIEIVKWAVGICILMGSLICLVASFGTLRLPDVYTRAHASSKGSTLGVNLVLLGVLGYLWMLTGENFCKNTARHHFYPADGAGRSAPHMQGRVQFGSGA